MQVGTVLTPIIAHILLPFSTWVRLSLTLEIIVDEGGGRNLFLHHIEVK